MKSPAKFFSTTLRMSTGILFLSVGLFLVSCESAGSDDAPPTPLTAVTATEIADNTGLQFEDTLQVDNRIHHALLSLSSSEAGEFTLGLRASSETAPTATVLTNAGGVIVRNLDTTAINVMLGFHMDASIFAADSTFDLTNYANNGDGSADVLTSILQEGTEYTLYATKSDGSSTVQAVMTLTTDTTPTTGDYFSRPIHVGGNNDAIDYTIRAGDPFLFLQKALIANNPPASFNIEIATGSGGTEVQTIVYPSGNTLGGTTAGIYLINVQDTTYLTIINTTSDNVFVTNLSTLFRVTTASDGNRDFSFTAVQ